MRARFRSHAGAGVDGRYTPVLRSFSIVMGTYRESGGIEVYRSPLNLGVRKRQGTRKMEVLLFSSNLIAHEILCFESGSEQWVDRSCRVELLFYYYFYPIFFNLVIYICLIILYLSCFIFLVRLLLICVLSSKLLSSFDYLYVFYSSLYCILFSPFVLFPIFGFLFYVYILVFRFVLVYIVFIYSSLYFYLNFLKMYFHLLFYFYLLFFVLFYLFILFLPFNYFIVYLIFLFLYLFSS